LDNLDRAVESIPVTEVDESVLKGIELVRRQFLDTLAKLDVKEIDALGKPFDPEYHNAVGQVDAEEGQEENTVVMVHQKGYKMAERVLRYSMVHVAR
ncbi:MAG: nucleotide exchange factor GrpE, partial [Clostridia bacterium]|nr:nucleotide exchange factor GrpE [Clostridia bacterium]